LVGDTHSHIVSASRPTIGLDFGFPNPSKCGQNDPSVFFVSVIGKMICHERTRYSSANLAKSENSKPIASSYAHQCPHTGIMAGSSAVRQPKTILAQSCEAVRSEIDQPKTLCNLAGIYVASQCGFQLRYELLLQRIND
jgi:hypothetical protein